VHSNQKAQPVASFNESKHPILKQTSGQTAVTPNFSSQQLGNQISFTPRQTPQRAIVKN
jgi:hypothetical protein